jgi:hypothetical protein
MHHLQSNSEETIFENLRATARFQKSTSIEKFNADPQIFA